MYLKKIAIKDIGPIEKLSIDLPFNTDGNPKPLILVGENGTGKTMCESQVIDAFYEIAGTAFSNVRMQEGLGYKYYKVAGGGQLRQGAENGFSLLQFESKSCGIIEYYDKINNVAKEIFTKYINDFGLSPNGQIDNHKAATNISENKKDAFHTEWNSGAYFYQPAHRFEEPFWKNDSFKTDDAIKESRNFTGYLNKEIEIISSSSKTKSFLLDLVLDFTRDLHANSTATLQNISKKLNDGGTVILADVIVNPVLDQQIWSNINKILRKIRRNEKIRFGVGQRGGTRISIVSLDMNNEVADTDLPSIDNLSLGEAVLLNLFINIVRHASNKQLHEIEGIVVIDEVDVHLHADLQNSALPELIKLFPKVQFIITSHSPLFVLGMQKEFGDDFELREMPTGEIITAERFSEFREAYRVLQETETFEEELKKAKQEITNEINSLKPNKIFICEDENPKIIALWEKWLGHDYLGLTDVKVITSKGSTTKIIEDGIRYVKGINSSYSPRVFRELDRDGLTDEQIKVLEEKLYKREKNDLDYEYSFLPVCEIENFAIIGNSIFTDEFFNTNKDDICDDFRASAATKCQNYAKLFDYEKEKLNMEKFRNSGMETVVVTGMQKQALKDWRLYMKGKTICEVQKDFSGIEYLSNLSFTDLPANLKDYLSTIKNHLW